MGYMRIIELFACNQTALIISRLTGGPRIGYKDTCSGCFMASLQMDLERVELSGMCFAGSPG